MAPVPPVVDAAWVRGHPDVVLADVRWTPSAASGPRSDGRAVHAAGHLPGAVFVDLDRDLAGEPSAAAGRHPLPSPERFAEAMSRLGIDDDDVVVAYDADVGAIAARLVWMLRATGRAAALLDGGLAAWDGPIETGEVARPPARFTARPWPGDRLADADEVARVAAAPESLVIDARARERYLGEVEPIDARAGHVPGAVSLPFAGNVDGGRFRPVDELRTRFAEAAAADDVVVYCGSGVTACHDVLALERAGIQARLYPGSWSAWSSDPARPVATGEG